MKSIFYIKQVAYFLFVLTCLWQSQVEAQIITTTGRKRYFRADSTLSDVNGNKWNYRKCWVHQPNLKFGETNWDANYNFLNDQDTLIIDSMSFKSGWINPSKNIVLDAGVHACHSLIFTPGSLAGIDLVASNPSIILQIHGNLQLQKHTGIPLASTNGPMATSTRQLSFNGTLRFFPNPASFPTMYNYYTGNVALNCPVVFYDRANYTIIGNFYIHQYSNGPTLTVDVDNGTISTQASDTCVIQGFSILSGTFNFNAHTQFYYPYYWGSTLYTKASASKFASNPPAVVNINNHFKNVINLDNKANSTINFNTNATHTVEFDGRFQNTAGAVVNLNNSVINFRNTPIFYSDGIGTISHGNSRLNFYTTQTSYTGSFLQIGSDTLNEVHIYGDKEFSTRQTPYFKKLVLEKGGVLSVDYSSPTILDNGSLELNEYSQFRFNTGVHPSYYFTLLNSTQFISNGTCAGPITIENGEFIFSATTTQAINYTNIISNKVTGPASPYATAATSNIIGISPGWLPNLNVGQIFYWQGAIPALTTDTAQYQSWHNAANWSLNPAATPSAPQVAAGCIPSIVDSVVFPDQSYVNIREVVANCKGMTWLSAGTLTGLGDTARAYSTKRYANLNIYGSLSLSTTMNNQFKGDIYFRAWDSYPVVKTNNRSFAGQIYFMATASNTTGLQRGSWLLQDSLIVNERIRDGGINGANTWNINFVNGAFNTNNNHIKAFDVRIQSRISLYDSIRLNLTTSRIHIRSILRDAIGYEHYNGHPFFIRGNSMSIGGNIDINPGTSHIIFKSDYVPSFGVSGYKERLYFLEASGHSLYDVSFMDNDESVILYNYGTQYTNFHNVKFYYQGTIYPAYGVNNYNINIHKLETNINDPNGTPFKNYYNTAVCSNLKTIVDSAIYHGNAELQMPTDYNYLMQLSAGKVYNIATTPNSRQNFPLATSVFKAPGTCYNPITINGGEFSSTVNTQSGDNLTVNNNTVVSTPNFTATAASSLNNTAGWDNAPQLGRLLRWKAPLVGNKGQWNDAASWDQIDNVGAVISANVCPPTCSDTALFNDISFSGVAGTDTVEIKLGSGIAVCHTMRWTNTANSAILYGATNENLQLCGSLYFQKSPEFDNKFNGDVTFRGTTPIDTIQSNGQNFKRHVYFNADAPTTVNWILKDSMVVNNSTVLNSIGTNGNADRYAVQFVKGTLNTNNQKCTWHTFYSDNSNYRKLILGSSVIDLSGAGEFPYTAPPDAGWYYGNQSFQFIGANSYVNAGTSTINFKGATGFSGGGHSWNKLNIYTHSALLWGKYSSVAGDTINDVNFYDGTSNGILYVVGSNYIKRLYVAPATSNLLKVFHTNRFDSLLSYRNTLILDSNYYASKFHFQPNKTYTFPSAKVQYFANKCEVRAIGLSGQNIVLKASNSTTPAYWRKDSGTVCTNFASNENIWGIGNGGNYFSPSTNTLVIYNDTILNSSIYNGVTQLPNGGAGVGIVNPATSGRAKFLAGTSAVLENNLAKGWDVRPYADIPTVVMSLSKDSICPGDSSQLSFTLTTPPGFLGWPVVITYSVNGGADTTAVLNNSTENPYRIYLKPTTGKVPVRISKLQVEKCFNNDTILNIRDTLIVADPPLSQALSLLANDTVCAGTNNLSLNPSSIATLSGGGAVRYDFFSPINAIIGSDNTAPYSFAIPGSATVDTWYYVQGRNSLGCKTGIDSVFLKVLPTPALVPISNKTICSDDTVNFVFNTTVALSNTVYDWTAAGANVTGYEVSGTTTTGFIDTLVTIQATNQTVTYTITPQTTTSGYTCPGAPQIITVTVKPRPTIGITPTFSTICSGQNFTYVPNATPSSAGTSYQWYSPLGNGNATTNGIANDNFSGTGGTYNLTTSFIQDSVIYYVRATNSNGCNQKDSSLLKVIVNPTPQVTSASAYTVCSNETTNITLTANPGTATFSWIGQNGTNVSGATTTTQTLVTITDLLQNSGSTPSTATYTISPVEGACSGSNQLVTVLVNPLPQLQTSPSQVLCTGSTANISLTSTPASTTWTVSGVGNGVTGVTASSNASSITDILVKTGLPATAIYTVQGTASGTGCLMTPTTLTVTVTDGLVITSASTDTICSGAGLNYTILPSGGASYVWQAVSNTNVTGESTTSQSGSVIDDNLAQTTSTNQDVIYNITGSLAGCPDGTKTVTVTVRPLPVLSSANNYTICSDATTAITLTTNISPTTYNWTGQNGTGVTGATTTNQTSSTITDQLSVGTNTTLGTATYTVTPSTAFCSGPNQVITVQVNPLPQLQTNTSQVICAGAALNIPITTLPSSTTYTVTGTGNGVTGVTASSNNSTITDNLMYVNSPATASYSVTSTSGAGCSNTLPSVITVTVTQGITITSANSDTICSGSNVNYTITPNSGGINYSWLAASNTNVTGESSTFQSGVTINDNLSQTTTNNEQVIYTVTGTLAGCPNATKTVTITVVPIPQAPSISFVGNSGNICNNGSQTATITATGSGTYVWYTNPTGGTSIYTGNTYTTSPLTTSTTYYVEATTTTTPACSNTSRTPVTVTITQPAALTITSFPLTQCDLSPITNLDSYISPSTAGIWQGTNVSGTTLTPDASTTTYTLLFTSNSVCGETATHTITISNNLPLSLSAYPSTTVKLNDPYSVIAFPSTYSAYSFSVNGTPTQTGSSNTLNQTPGNLGEYMIVVNVTENGCTNTDSIKITVLNVPNVFTPDGDGKNDLFAKGLDKQIINRWGDVIYEGIEGWDGKDKKGQMVVPGTYFYIIKEIDPDTKQQKFTNGSVEVLKIH